MKMNAELLIWTYLPLSNSAQQITGNFSLKSLQEIQNICHNFHMILFALQPAHELHNDKLPWQLILYY